MAAGYEQPKDVVKRVRFFDGQYLQDQDFVDEQHYHIDRQRRHNRTLHVGGIADGLGVTSVVGAPQVLVQYQYETTLPPVPHQLHQLPWQGHLFFF